MRTPHAKMTVIKYAPSAKHDFAEISQYYLEISRQTFGNVMDDIASCIDVLTSNPEAGIKFRSAQRRIVSTKYRFVVVYLLEDNNQTARIIGIYRFQNR